MRKQYSIVAGVSTLIPGVVVGVGDFSLVVVVVKSALVVVDVLVDGDTVEMLSVKQCKRKCIIKQQLKMSRFNIVVTGIVSSSSVSAF